MSSTRTLMFDRYPDPYKLGRNVAGGGHRRPPSRSESGPAPKRIVVAYGFWIFILSDFVIFSCFFAAYAVLAGSTAGGPAGHDIFDIGNVALETAFLLLSSFCCGLAAVAMLMRNMLLMQLGLLVTGLFGAGFIALEILEFYGLTSAGHGPDQSAFLSAFFALVGCHGLHVTAGLLWLGTVMAQVWVKGFTPRMYRRMLCFNLFWHALDIIWVAIFTVVYLFGVAA